MKSLLLAVLPPLVLLSGCATSAPQAALPAVQQQLADRGQPDVAWPLTAAERQRSDAAVATLLGAELTPDSAVRIALLNNRALRATFEELGLSQAAVGAASRLPNPSFAAGVRWPDSNPRGPTVEFGLTAPLLESLLLPTRRRIAEDMLVAAQYRVSHEVLVLAAAVRRSTYEVLAQQDLRARLVTIGESTAAAAEFAERQYSAGNISQLERLEIHAAAQESRVQLSRADAELIVLREHLSQLLGLSAGQTGWTLAGALPALPAADLLPDDLERVALDQRLDLAARHTQAALAERALAFKVRTRPLPAAIDLGVNTEREGDGNRLTGPHLSAELPLFDQGQPELARLSAESRQAQDLAAALAADIGSEVRIARAALSAARQAAAYHHDTVVPQRAAILRETLLHYNAMQVSVYVLLQAKAAEQAAERAGIEALRDYWLARVDLERALGRRLPDPVADLAATSSTSLPLPASAATTAEHHHP